MLTALARIGRRWATPSNLQGLWQAAISRSTVLLHYSYTSPEDVAAKASRGCPKEHAQAALRGDFSLVRAAGGGCCVWVRACVRG